MCKFLQIYSNVLRNNQMTCTNVQMCSDVYKCIQTCTNVQMCVQMCLDIYKCVQTCKNLFSHVQMGSDMWKYVLTINLKSELVANGIP